MTFRPTVSGITSIHIKFDYLVFPTATAAPICTAITGFSSIACSVDTTTYAGVYWQIIASGLSSSSLTNY